MDERLLNLLKDARQQLEVERERRTSPIAIVGIGCRFPGGVNSPESFWRLLRDGIDASTSVPLDRWDAEAFYDPDPDAPGKAYSKRGSFLERVDAFEPEFFGISPREALGMDPQQRLLLEVTWEALEDAGMAPPRLRGSGTGVWVGLCFDDYARRSLMSGDPAAIDAYNALGNTRSVAAGRISYVFDLHGPTVQLDTACSSSLVAIHQACQSLRLGECELAIVAGVNVMAAPETTISLCKVRALAKDGRCKTFDASADGYGRGEGCGVVILKRLGDARASGDRIIATVRGSAVNHDGQSNGLTAPSGSAQEAVIRAAIVNAGVEPRDVGYVETHGTGTLLGDPIEVLALSRVYGRGRAKEAPLHLGSVKTNFGHLEGAAGIAGLIKAALCLSKRQLTPHLHLERPSPKIPWADLPVLVGTELMPWPRGAKPLLAGISSFGISGTNAHIVLEEAVLEEAVLEGAGLEGVAVDEVALEAAAPGDQRGDRAFRSAEPIVLSAKTPEALSASQQQLQKHIEQHPELPLGDVAFSLVSNRSWMPHRVAFVAVTREALLERLGQVADPPAAPTPAALSNSAPKVAFIFPGQGSQWLGMGRQLLKEEPEFRRAMEACDAAIRFEAGWSVIDELLATGTSRLDRVDVVQPVLFAVQVALAALWRSWGVEPAAVVGHSMGEVAAAVVAGGLSLQGGAAVTCRRSRLLRRISGQGEMALVELSIEDAASAISGLEDRLGIAVSNSVSSTVLSGDPSALGSVLAELEGRGVFCRRVKVDVASHSPQVDPLLEDLRASLLDLLPGRGSIPMHSTVRDAVLQGPELDAQYWAENLRQPVRFARAIASLFEEGFTLFVEISPHPLLVTAVQQMDRDLAAGVLATGSLRRDQPERSTLLESLTALWVHGHPLDAKRLFPAGSRRVSLPSYPWQRQRYWTDAHRVARGAAGALLAHPLLGVRIPTASADAIYESILSAQSPQWLGEHRVSGNVVAPGVALAELFRAAADDFRAGAASELRCLTLQAPLLFSGEAAMRVQVVLSEQGERGHIYSQPADSPPGSPWLLHATVDLADRTAPAAVDVHSIRKRCTEVADVAALYERCAVIGLEYGPTFRGLRRLWRGSGEVLAEIELDAAAADANEYGVHPGLLDSALQALVGLVGADYEQPLLPFEIGRVAVHQPGASRALVHLELSGVPTGDGVAANIVLIDPGGAVLAEVMALQMRRVDIKSLQRLSSAPAPEALYRMAWPSVPAPRPMALAGSWRVLSIAESRNAEHVAADLRVHGVRVDVLASAPLGGLPPCDHLVCVCDPPEPNSDAAIRAVVEGLAVMQAVLTAKTAPQVWWVTRRGVAITPAEDENPAASAVWGLVRSVMQEHPELGCKLVDIDDAVDLARALGCEQSVSGAESQIAWRGTQRFLARLERVSAVPSTPVAKSRALEADGGSARGPWSTLRTSGTVLITGGLGGIGLEVAKSFARHGVEHLVLVGRRGAATPEAERARLDLEALGATVTVAAADVADREALERVLASIPERYPLRGIVHAAGILDDGGLLEQTPDRFIRVMNPKVKGAWNLHELTLRTELDMFLSFSSVSGVLGSAGQTGYAAANAFLDGLASHRRARGLPGASQAWGPWAEVGLAARLDASAHARFAREGIGMITPAEGIALLDDALAIEEPRLLIVPFDLRVLARNFGASVPPLWSALLRPTPQRGGKASSIALDVAALPEDQRMNRMVDFVRAGVARVLSLGSLAAVPADRRIKDLGLDSLMALELRNSLGRDIGVPLPATLAFDHPTPQAMARYLLDDVLRLAPNDGSGGPRPAAEAPASSRLDRRARAAAIVREELAAGGGALSPNSAEALAERLVALFSDDAEPENLPANFEADAVLDGTVKPVPGPPPAFDPTSVLLTGATGFLGAYILAELLTQTSAHVTCLVRASDSVAGIHRVAENLRRYGLWNDAFKWRMAAVPGDLQLPRLGLDEETFNRLGSSVDAIYNNGAQLSFVAQYPELKDSHVGGTREALRLASIGRPKSFHHVSSVAVYDAAVYRRMRLPEDQPPLESLGINLPYAQCKWVAEALVRKAGELGLPVTIYRAGLIGGDSSRGAANTDDFFCRILTAIVETGCMPDLDVSFDIAPVDYVGRGLVYLSRQPASRGNAFLLQHPRGLDWQQEFCGILRSLGCPVRLMPYDAWLAEIERHPGGSLEPLLPYLQRRVFEGKSHLELFQRRYRPVLTCEITENELAGGGIKCPPLDEALIGKYLDFLESVDFLRRPKRSA